MRELRDEDDEDQIEEQLEEGDPAILGSVLETGRRVPPPSECERSGHRTKLTDVRMGSLRLVAVHQRRDFRSQQLDRPQHLTVWKRPHADVKHEALDAENLTHALDLGGHGFDVSEYQ